MAWFDEFFDDHYNRTYRHLNREKTKKDVDYITKALDLSRDHEILDIPCGFGRHAIELTRRGYKVTGMEYNQSQIDRARELMKEEGVEFPIIKADMRDIPLEKQYDRAYNYFTSFGYFSDEDNDKTMGEFYKVLKPGGLFLMECANRDGILKNFKPCDISHYFDGSIFIDEREFDPFTSRISGIHTLISPDGKIEKRNLVLRFYSLHELTGLFKKHGFEIVKVYGRGEEEFETFSFRMAMVTRKKD